MACRCFVVMRIDWEARCNLKQQAFPGTVIFRKWPSENTGGKLPWPWKKTGIFPGKYHPKMVDFPIAVLFYRKCRYVKSDILGQFQVGRIANRKTDLLFSMGFAEDGGIFGSLLAM